MVFGLLTLAALPTTIGVSQAISSTNKEPETEDPFLTSTTEEQRMRQFLLRCYCDPASSSKAREINGGSVILRDQRLWILPPSSSSSSSFLGFYVPYPDPSRKPFAPCGLVSFIPSAPGEKQMLNWIFVDKRTRELRYSNRTGSLEHVVGSWGWDTEEEGGGVTLDGEERGVAVETEDGWQLFWEYGDGKKRLDVSIERVFVKKDVH
ncbi:MAG: hypothetical protein Q9212_003838 [Teloschistes hypoglaucus]